MKKLYSLFAAVVMTVAVNAQGSESFTNLTASTNGYSDGSYTGDNGVQWTFGQARKTTTTDAITGTTIGFSTSGNRFVRANSGANGVGTLTYTVSSYFTGGVASDRKIEVWVNGVMLETFTLAAMSTDYVRTVTADFAGDVLIEFKSVGTRQLVLDDVAWTAASVLGVADDVTTKKSLVKNTAVENEITFASKSDVKIYSVNGQIVKSASVNENTSLNVSDLPKGMYIVAGTVDGEAVSQKILKK